MSVESKINGARVIVIEDMFIFQDAARESLEKSGHQVIGRVTSHKEVSELVRTLKAMKAEELPQAAAIDRNLDPSDSNDSVGQGIVDFLRREFPLILLIGISSSELLHVDLNLGKDNIGKLGAAVTDLLAQRNQEV